MNILQQIFSTEQEMTRCIHDSVLHQSLAAIYHLTHIIRVYMAGTEQGLGTGVVILGNFSPGLVLEPA